MPDQNQISGKMPFMDFHANDLMRLDFHMPGLNTLKWLGNFPGWGNGYVYLPKGHPYYGKKYHDIPYQVYRGLNYSKRHGDWWVIGWDTCHGGDTLETWPEERVRTENAKLLAQAMADMILITMSPEEEGGIS